MIAISITLAAFEAIKSTLPKDADAFPPQLDERGGVRFVVDHKTFDRADSAPRRRREAIRMSSCDWRRRLAVSFQ
jgi:hypothetical protein